MAKAKAPPTSSPTEPDAPSFWSRLHWPRQLTPCPVKVVMVLMFALYAVILFNVVGRFEAYNKILGASGRIFGPFQDVPKAYIQLDSYMWVENARQLAERGGFRLRHTDVDNAPLGSRMDWNSGYSLFLCGLGWVRHYLTDRDLVSSIDMMASWSNPILFTTFLFFLMRWAGRRFGWVGALVAGTGLLCQQAGMEVFEYGYVDHHGIILALALCGMLTYLSSGAGWSRTEPRGDMPVNPVPIRKEARRLMIASGIFFGIGFWISMSTMVFIMFACGLGTALALLLVPIPAPNQTKDAHPDPDLFRVWSRAGALTAFVLYLFEYFPNHMGLRMEFNNPLFALAWLGAGEILATFSTLRLQRTWKLTRNQCLKLVIALGVVAIPPVLVFTLREKVYAPLNPFLNQLYSTWIYELKPLSFLLERMGNDPMQLAGAFWFSLVAALTALGILIYRGFHRPESVPLLVGTVAILILLPLGFWQMRWLSLLPIANLPVVFVCLPWLLQRGRSEPKPLAPIAFSLITAITLLIYPIRYIPAAIQERWKLGIGGSAAAIIGVRDLGLLWRHQIGDRPATMLASPNNSIILAHTGKFKVIGVLYWPDGQINAAKIFAAQSFEEAKKLFDLHGISHVAMISWENFIQPYIMLSLGKDYTDEKFKKSFAYRITYTNEIPDWLLPVDYKPPQGLDLQVRLYEVKGWRDSAPQPSLTPAPAADEQTPAPTQPLPAPTSPGNQTPPPSL